MNTHMAKITKLQEQLTAKSTELSRLPAMHKELTNELSLVKSQQAARALVLDDLESVPGNCERPNKRASIAG